MMAPAASSPAASSLEETAASIAQLEKSRDFAGVQLFCFGGFVKTCRWLQAIADGRFILDDAEGFRV